MQLLYSSNIPGILENVSISQIILPEFYYREKEYDDEIENLTFSMKQYGLLNPITVRNLKNYFEIILLIYRTLLFKSLRCKIRSQIHHILKHINFIFNNNDY